MTKKQHDPTKNQPLISIDDPPVKDKPGTSSISTKELEWAKDAYRKAYSHSSGRVSFSVPNYIYDTLRCHAAPSSLTGPEKDITKDIQAVINYGLRELGYEANLGVSSFNVKFPHGDYMNRPGGKRHTHSRNPTVTIVIDGVLDEPYKPVEKEFLKRKSSKLKTIEELQAAHQKNLRTMAINGQQEMAEFKDAIEQAQQVMRGEQSAEAMSQWVMRHRYPDPKDLPPGERLIYKAIEMYSQMIVTVNELAEERASKDPDKLFAERLKAKAALKHCTNCGHKHGDTDGDEG